MERLREDDERQIEIVRRESQLEIERLIRESQLEIQRLKQEANLAQSEKEKCQKADQEQQAKISGLER